MRSILAVSAAALSLSLLPAAVATAQQSRSLFESCGPVLDSQLCTWVVMDGGAAVELGATLPLAIVEGVPTDAEMVWPPEELAAVAMPAEARASLGIDHLGINWEAHGHPPAPFLAPHFDFHFYTLDRSGIGAIDCADQTKPPTLPAGHVLPDIEVPGLGMLIGLCVPRMGMHAMLAEAMDEPFEASMIIGYYGGQPIHFEPMVSRERLLERSDFALGLPRIDDLPPGVRYPSRLHATYDAANDEYRLVFTGFGPRRADEGPDPSTAGGER